LSVAVLLPFEMATGFLQHTAERVAAIIDPSSGVTYDSPIKGALDLVMAPAHALAGIFSSPVVQGFVLIVASALMIFYALAMLVRTLRSTMTGKAHAMIQAALGRHGLVSIILGMLITMAVQ